LIGNKNKQLRLEWWLLWLGNWLEGRFGTERARWSTAA